MNPIVKDKVKKTPRSQSDLRVAKQPKGKYIPKKSLGRVDNSYEHDKAQDLRVTF